MSGDESMNDVKMDLLGMDAFMTQVHASVLLTFEGSMDEAVGYLKERVAAVVKANPFLAGRVVRTAMAKAELHYPKEVGGVEDVFEVTDSEELRGITSSTPYAEVQAKVLNHLKTHLNRSLRVTAWAEPSSTTFRVHFSMNHGIGDGASLYRFLNMLSSDETVAACDATRKAEFQEKQLFDAWTHESYPSVTSFSRFGSSLYRLFWMKVCPWTCADRSACYKIRNEYIEEAKKEGAKDGGFVSTNDVITSWWFNKMPNAIARLMAVNTRGRLPGYDADLIGNYMAVVAFSQSEKIDPKTIRRALPERADKKGPAFAKQSVYYWMTNHQALVTNWATFYKTLKIPGAQQRHHLALVIMDGQMPRVNSCVIYKANENQTNVLIDIDPTMPKSVKVPDADLEDILEPVAH
eukprot:TRINITY_DN1547_c0_g1_i2.p1 TRINITY_DN1547_c0_g1~~TRINITY_DN1547_c0_g1_i2.p1  ORF type:complete len:423 (+),score=126.80 TRINITY_DN1547_c0_g1_i2:50-1270(+)